LYYSKSSSPLCPCPLGGVHLNARLCVVVETALLLGSHHIDGFHKVLVHDDRGFPKRRTRGVILRERKRRERRKGRDRGWECERDRGEERDMREEIRRQKGLREVVRR
jgi:hypothetical protein